MMKKTITAALAVCFALNAYASEKITLDMAIEQDAAARAYNNSVDMGALQGGMSQDALENTGSGAGWKAHWSGSTIGSVSIPRSAKEVFVRYSINGSSLSPGYNQFPVNGGAITFATASDSDRNGSSESAQQWSCSVVAKGQYSNFTVSGQQAQDRFKRCLAKVAITSVMYR